LKVLSQNKILQPYKNKHSLRLLDNTLILEFIPRIQPSFYDIYLYDTIIFNTQCLLDSLQLSLHDNIKNVENKLASNKTHRAITNKNLDIKDTVVVVSLNDVNICRFNATADVKLYVLSFKM